MDTRLIVVLVAFWLLLPWHLSARSQPSADSLNQILMDFEKAKSLVGYRPEQAREILSEHQQQVSSLPAKQQISWRFAEVQIAMKLGDSAAHAVALNKLFELHGTKEFKKATVPFLTYSGHFFTQKNHLEMARKSYMCALNSSSDNTAHFALLFSLAVVFEKSGELDEARHLFHTLLAHFEAQGRHVYRSMLENALGVIALSLEDFDSAERHFKRAMEMHQREGKRGDHLNSSLNLLLTYLLSAQHSKFHRLMPRIKLMLDEFPDRSKKVYLAYLIATDSVMNGAILDDEAKQGLKADFNKADNALIKDAIRTYLADKLDITLEPLPLASDAVEDDDTHRAVAALCQHIEDEKALLHKALLQLDEDKP